MSPPSRTMLLAFLFLCTFMITTLASPKNPKPPSSSDKRFQQLLADVDEQSIHSVLHAWSGKFKDGVFSRDRTAIEHVHSEDAPLATKLLQLAKRASNITTTSTTTLSTFQTTTSTSLDTTTTPIAPTTSNVPPPPTTSSLPPTSQTSIPSPVTIVTAEPSSLTVLVTATLSGGEQSVSTSVTVVGAQVTTVITPSAAAASGATSTPHLQNIGASSFGRSSKFLVTAAIGVCGIASLV